MTLTQESDQIPPLEQLAGQGLAVKAEAHIAHRADEQHVQPEPPGFFMNVVGPARIADVEHGAFERVEAAIQARRQVAAVVAQHHVIHIRVERDRRRRQFGLVLDLTGRAGKHEAGPG